MSIESQSNSERKGEPYTDLIEQLEHAAEEAELNELHDMYDSIAMLRQRLSRRIASAYKDSTIGHWDDVPALCQILEAVKADTRLRDDDTLEKDFEGKGERQRTIDFVEKLIRDGDLDDPE